MTSGTHSRLDLVYIKNGGRTKTPADGNQRYWLYDEYALSKLGIELVDVFPRENWDRDQASLISRLESDEDSRFRHNTGNLLPADFVLEFEFEVRRNRVEAQCSIMKCQRSTGLEAVAKMFECMKNRVSGNREAGNGSLKLRVTWQPVARQPMFILRLEEILYLRCESTDATLELERLDLMMEFVGTLEAEGLSVAEEEKRWTDVQKRWNNFRRVNGGEDGYKLEKSHNRSPFQWAVENGYIEMSRLLLVKTGFVTIAGNDSWTPLIAASRKGYIDMIKQLLASKTIQGVDLEAKDPATGQTVLLWAAEKGYTAIVQLLVEKGANIEARGAPWPMPWSRTALARAAEKGHAAIVQLLLEEGAYMPLTDEEDLLFWAVKNGHDSIRLLLQERAAPKSKGLTWAMALPYAAGIGKKLRARTEEPKDSEN
ncbi:unnamed protein product [Clonostachys byssicola]|uniref:Uncharacterized protein n=1 Tax=Clonostachys byssicola TaxID=160290 RepID=A0A9N9U7Z0_9HYPO|nr:unnamed protein product [Clonostachys byssicola]